jgi:hypothetical protein
LVSQLYLGGKSRLQMQAFFAPAGKETFFEGLIMPPSSLLRHTFYYYYLHILVVYELIESLGIGVISAQKSSFWFLTLLL